MFIALWLFRYGATSFEHRGHNIFRIFVCYWLSNMLSHCRCREAKTNCRDAQLCQQKGTNIFSCLIIYTYFQRKVEIALQIRKSWLRVGLSCWQIRQSWLSSGLSCWHKESHRRRLMRDYRYQKEIDERLPLPKGGGWEITATLKTYISLLFV